MWLQKTKQTSQMIEKIFNFEKGVQGLKVKVCKQVRDQKVWKQVKGGAQ